MLKKILIVLGALMLVLVAVIATRPADFRYARSRTMAVPAAAVFAQVDTLSRWNDWSPWAKLDPDCKNTLTGPASGKGASFAWDGNNDVGAGVMTITDSLPPQRVAMKLVFHRPMAGESDVVFTFVPEGDKTVVTWTMSGKNNFMGKAVGLFIDCEKMCGDQFEQGLAAMEKSALSGK